MSDSRIAEFTKYWHEKYKEREGISFRWGGGKEQKLMQKTIAYFESQYGEDAMGWMQSSAEEYLKDESEFVKETAHDLSIFLTQANKWLKKAKDRQDKKSQEIALSEEKERAQERLKALKPQHIEKKELSEEEIKAWIEKDPIRFMKGFKATHHILKKMNPDSHARYCKMIVEVLGRDRARSIWAGEETSPEVKKAEEDFGMAEVVRRVMTIFPGTQILEQRKI